MVLIEAIGKSCAAKLCEVSWLVIKHCGLCTGEAGRHLMQWIETVVACTLPGLYSMSISSSLLCMLMESTLSRNSVNVHLI